MLNRLFGGSTGPGVSENKRQRVEGELLVFVRPMFSFLELVAPGARQDRVPEETESAANRAAASASKLRQLWPEGESALPDLQRAADVIPDHVATFRSWEELSKRIESDPAYGDAKRRMKELRKRRKELSRTMDKSLSGAIDRLRGAGIDFISISAQAQKTFRHA
jgi:hypothetical protein